METQFDAASFEDEHPFRQNTQSSYVLPLRSPSCLQEKFGRVEAFPEVNLAPWGSDWAKDILVLVQNAVLSELRDLFSLAAIMERRKFVLDREHVNLFFVWFDEMALFIEACLDILESCVFEWVTVKGRYTLEGPVRDSQRMLHFGSFRRTIELISEYRYEFHPNLPVGERVSGLSARVRKLSAVPVFYNTAYEFVPGFIRKHRIWTPWRKSLVFRRIVQKLRRYPGHETNLVLLTRWMPSSDARNWCTKYLQNPADMMKYPTWRVTALSNHCDFVQTFNSMIGKGDRMTMNSDLGVAMAIQNRDELERTRDSVTVSSSKQASASLSETQESLESPPKNSQEEL